MSSSLNKTGDQTIFALASIAASTVTVGSETALATQDGGLLHVYAGRRAATAAGAVANIRIEGSYKAAGGVGTWNPLAILAFDFAACEAEAVSGTVGSGTNVITVASTTNLTAGDVIFIDNGTIANSEWHRIKSIVSNTSVTTEENLANAQTGSTLYDSAAIFNLIQIPRGIVRLRIVADGSLFTQAWALFAKLVTVDSIG